MEPHTQPILPDTADYLHASDTDASSPFEGWQPLSLDSVFAAYLPKEAVQHPSLFTEHSLQPQHDAAIANTIHHTPGWIFGLFVILIALLSLYLNSFRVQIRRLFGSAISLREMEYFYRDNNFKRPASVLPMMLFYAAAMALCLFFFADTNHIALFYAQPWANYLVLFGLLAAYFLLKNALIYLLGNIFSNLNAARLYNANNYIYQLSAAFVLLPLSLFAFYGPCEGQQWSRLLLYIVAFAFFIRFFRGIKLILTNANSSKFYLFYYLCTLEIVPLLILGKEFISL